MHIFMTNDDGFESPGLIEMAKKLSRLGRVTVIAPNRGRSSCSSSLSLQTYLRMWHKESYGENISVLSCNGTTADCCKLALEHWLRNDMPDLVVSGINNGYNSGTDCLYSGRRPGRGGLRHSLHRPFCRNHKGQRLLGQSLHLCL